MNFQTCPCGCGLPLELASAIETELLGGELTVISFGEGLPITPADLGLDIDLEAVIAGIIAEQEADEFEARIESALAEVEVGNILSNDEGQVLAAYIGGLEDALDEAETEGDDYRSQLIAEEQAHAETLADLYESQDEVAALKAQVYNQARLLELAALGLKVAVRTIERQATERALINVFYGV